VANRLIDGLLILVWGLALFMFRWFVPEETYMYYIAALTFAFLALTVLSMRSRAIKHLWPVFFAFAISGLVLTLNMVIVPLTMMFFGISKSMIDGYAWIMLVEAAVTVLTIVLFVKLQGESLKSLYLKRGNLRLGLAWGLSGLVAVVAASVVAVQFLFQGTDLTLASLGAWAPWIALAVLSSAPKEELQFRGLFLKRYEKLMGLDLANLLQALIFISTGFREEYLAFLPSTFLPPFLLMIFILGLALGALMQKTDSLLGSVLIRAGASIPVVIGIFASL